MTVDSDRLSEQRWRYLGKLNLDSQTYTIVPEIILWLECFVLCQHCTFNSYYMNQVHSVTAIVEEL